MTKDKLTAGKKTDKDLHKLICREYNNKSKQNQEVFPVPGKSSLNPAIFEGPIVWQQSVKALKQLTKDYKYCLNNWRLSGNHSAFGEIDKSKPELPFANFINNNMSLFYLHEFANLYPNILKDFTADLPSGVFRDLFASSDAETTMATAASTSLKLTNLAQKRKANKAMMDKEIFQWAKDSKCSPWSDATTWAFFLSKGETTKRENCLRQQHVEISKNSKT